MRNQTENSPLSQPTAQHVCFQSEGTTSKKNKLASCSTLLKGWVRMFF